MVDHGRSCAELAWYLHYKMVRHLSIGSADWPLDLQWSSSGPHELIH